MQKQVDVLVESETLQLITDNGQGKFRDPGIFLRRDHESPPTLRADISTLSSLSIRSSESSTLPVLFLPQKYSIMAVISGN
jgi:hypothetical protein